MIRNYRETDFPSLAALWNTAGTAQGYAPQSPDALAGLLTENPYFSREYAFVLEESGAVTGFACGCAGDDLPQGETRGYFTCLLLERESAESAAGLLAALENAFRRAGKTQAAASFFNPMRLPWIVPGTPGHQHNNCPGVAEDLPLHRYMADADYAVRAVECAMYLDLSQFEMPEWAAEKSGQLVKENYTVDWYRSGTHHGLTEMVHSMGNPMWDAEIPEAAEKINMLVALHGSEVVGFAGPVYREKTGRGYFAGIAVSALHEGHGLGGLLFCRLCQTEKEAGSEYMSLFTGSDNHAQRIYLRAGFQVRRRFAVMTKEL